jgi:hypothetical protein
MKEYFGENATKYKQTKGKNFLLANKKGYRYFGIDISKEMIERARRDFPEGEYQVGRAEDLAKKYS